MNRIRPLILPFCMALFIVTAVGLLAGCGGGDDLDEDTCDSTQAADGTKRLPAAPCRSQGV